MDYSFFPKSKLKAGDSVQRQQNLKEGKFTGVIKGIRKISSANAPTVFAVIDIAVEGESDAFQDFLNFNGATPEKEQGSVNHLVYLTRDIILSSGGKISEGEKDMEWVQNTLPKLVGKEIYFSQTKTESGLSIRYLRKPTVEEF